MFPLGKLQPDKTEDLAPNSARERHSQWRVEHWNRIALEQKQFERWSQYYHSRLEQVYSLLIPPGQRVLELGCGRGDLLAAVKPAVGVGVDLSPEMIRAASARHPDQFFINADIHDLDIEDNYDAIILSDVVNDLWDVLSVFAGIRKFTAPHTRIILNCYSRLWEPALAAGEFLGLCRPTLRQNWLNIQDLRGFLELSEFEIIRTWQEVIWPLNTPLLAPFCNRFLVRLPFFRHLALTNFIIARPRPEPVLNGQKKVSIVVPARNEAGNIESIFERTPAIGADTELIFVEGHSSDDTYTTIEQAIANHPERSCLLLKQSGKGKGDAVRLGFAHATGDVLMILDADLTVRPEDLPRFYEALASGKAEFVNGVRHVYPMEEEAMRFWNIVGNRFFSLAFSWLLGQPIKDTLCGTKVLWRSDYERIAANRSYFGDFDPFGDFDLLFGAAKLNIKIVDLPVRYARRTYGTTNIQRWRHGWLLLQMVCFAAARIKFI